MTRKQIDSFLSVITKDEKIFWLKFRRKLELLNESRFLLPLEEDYLTIGAKEALEESNQLPNEFLARYQKGNFGAALKTHRRKQLEAAPLTDLSCFNELHHFPAGGNRHHFFASTSFIRQLWERRFG